MHVVVLHNAVEADDPVEDQDVLVQVQAVRAALTRLGHHTSSLPCTLNLLDTKQRLRELGPDCVFNLVESLDHTDRLLYLASALLDRLGLPYTGCPTEALFLTNNKLLAKQRLIDAGLPTPAWIAHDGRREGAEMRWTEPSKYILKTIHEHASFEMDDDAIVEVVDSTHLQQLLRERSIRLGRPCFAEAFVDGREFNLSMLASSNGPRVLPPAEIDFSSFPADKPRIVGHQAKWDDRSFAYHHTPRSFDIATTDRPLLERLSQLALDCWDLFGLQGYARVDFRVDREQRPWILEINANPCLAPDAGFAAALSQAGLGYDEAIARIVQQAYHS